MRHFDAKTETGGFTFAELACAMLVLVIGVVLLLNHLSINYMSTATERDRVFAYSKAQAILSEVQSFADRGTLDVPIDLDALDDGIINKSELTIQTDSQGNLVLPDHVVSGNYRRDGDWIWSRRITVRPFAGVQNRNVRYVTVRIFRRDKNGVERSMADLSAVINSAGGAFPTTQVFDVYLLAVENIPGWWVFMDSIKPFVESMISDLENRNPGLQFRTHWITKASFGRNQGYRPYTNEDTDSLAPIPSVYHYPGHMPVGSASIYYYVPENIRARLSVDGVERNGYDAASNPLPYALADFFNHGMRYPDELALWQARVAAVELREAEMAADRAAGLPPRPGLTDMSKEPTLRLLLEDMCTAPQKHKNSLVVNLHGELLPMPALRNYSDAARDPETVAHQGLRVVTHPEKLRTTRASPVTEALNLRMYAWHTGNTPGVMPAPMAVEVVGMNLTDPGNPSKLRNATCTLTNVPGGVTIVGGSANYSTTWMPAKHVNDAHQSNEMYYQAAFVTPAVGEPFTRILLYNTPVTAPAITQSGQVYGLASSTAALKEQSHLYQMPYVPNPVGVSPLTGLPDFNIRDLTKPNTGPKNTARWVLSINPSVFTTNGSFVQAPAGDVMLQIRTRIWSTTETIGSSLYNSGTMWPTPVQPENLSTTYAWWADSKDDVPFTERAQFNGDPRHVPYKDCFNGAVDYRNGYNWYHDSLNNNSEPSIQDYPCIAASVATSPLRNRWQASGGSQLGMSCDVPRYMELLRTALVRSACVYTTLTGYSYFYLGIGQDIGYDSANGYPNSIPSNMTPHGSPGTNGYINTILGPRRFARAAGSNYWWGMPWLGELCPDNQYATMWRTNGNLTAGTSAGQYYQGTVNSVYTGSTGTAGRQAYGTAMLDYFQRTYHNGCTSFFNIGTASSTFHHTSSNANGTLTPIGLELANNYNMAMPTSALISRPFGLNWNGTTTGGTGDEFSHPLYLNNRHSATLYRTYYTHPAGTGSGLVKLVDPTNTSAAYIVVNGIDNTVASGTTFIAKFAVLSLVHSFFEAGSTTNSLRIPQLARLEIESPTEITELISPSTIVIQYGVDWKRWDGLPYTATGTFTEDELQLEYVLMCSKDGGRTWRHIQDDSEATPGTRPAPAYLVPDSGVGSETFDWPVPALNFPEGSYLLRIDCFRRGAAVHYSYHQTRIYIQR
ncbi:MAG TPA: hypothetical protein VFD82_24035 [Planctomycetota bacterium]|nr:hypothetical protein [Planctomycetota bacterium]